jgi:hypothetical protein
MGVKLEQRCPLIAYAIVDSGPLPHGGTNAGGTAFYAGCNIEYMAKYSILNGSKIGPWDVHELLHHYEWGGPGLPNMHSLFQSLMTEAMREIGDDEHYDQSIAYMRKDVARTFGNNCFAAQSKTEEMLYLEDSSNVYRFVRELDRGIADPNERMNRMLFNVSGRKDSVRKFLTDHGCAAFR